MQLGVIPLLPWHRQSLVSAQMVPTLAWNPAQWTKKIEHEYRCKVRFCSYYSCTQVIQCIYVLLMYHKIFDVSEEVTKVNVEEVSWGSYHDVVVMTITNALQRERGRKVSTTLVFWLATYMCSNLPAHRWPQSSQHRTEQRCPQLQPTCQNQPHHTHWMRKQPIHIHSTLEHQYCKNIGLNQFITDLICWLLIHSNSFLLSLVPETCTEGRMDRQQTLS